MKKIFQNAMIGLLVIFVACNDADEKEDSTTTDTPVVSTDNNAVAENNVMNKTGLALGPDQEVPPNNSTGKGTADVTYNKDTKMLTYTVNWSGLTGDATMAHIHGTAPKGVNAGVKHDLTGKLQKAPAGSFTDSVKIDGSGIKEDSLLSGFYYFNIHTAKHPGGEIRGQIEF